MDRTTGVQIHPIQALHKTGTVRKEKLDIETDLQKIGFRNGTCVSR